MAALVGWQHHPVQYVLSALFFVLHLLVAARAITRPDREPASRVAWVAVIMALPVLGVVAYLLLGETSIGRARVRRLREAETRMPIPDVVPPAPDSLTPQAQELFDLGRTISGFPPTAGNLIEVVGDPAAPADQPMIDSDIALDTLIADIEAAREHVHISFYIWFDDHHGGRVAEAVAAAARRGVACRVMVDAHGSHGFVRSPRWKQLRQAGVHTVATLDDIPHLGNLAVGRVDLRNHRKIVVIDNRIAYCGSQNCADPQFRTEPRFAPWVDIWLRCQGPVVRQEQRIFLSTWIAETGEALDDLACAGPPPENFTEGAIAQMFGTGPTSQGNSMSDMFVATLFSAQRELIVTTPYFVPDQALLRALCAAPRRGVDTTVVFPARNNSRLVQACCRSTYRALLEGGVRIMEYPLGLLHTKTITVDGQITLVGSANMDRRSLELNFENNMVVADTRVTAAIRQRQQSYLAVSRPVDVDTVNAWSFLDRLGQNTVGMMAPLL